MSGRLAALLIHSVGSGDAHLRALGSLSSSSGQNTFVMYVCGGGYVESIFWKEIRGRSCGLSFN